MDNNVKKNNSINETLEGILGLIVIAIIIFVCWKIFGNNDKNSNTNNTNDSSIIYTTVSYDTLFDDWYNNKARAKDKYEGKYVQIINAKVRRVDTFANSINIESSTGEYFIESITCLAQTAEQKAFIKKLNTDDNVIVKGKIIHVGNMFEYTLSITDIYK